MRTPVVVACLLAARASAQSPPAAAPSAPPHLAPADAVASERAVRFAVIGDYGNDSADEAAVAALVKSLHPQFVVTLGDNNYPEGAAATIDANVGKHYHDFIAPYSGAFGAGASANRFFPRLGNHDWVAAGAAPYLAYFALPGNERYYALRRGPVHLFALDSDPSEPDGVTSSSAQAQWLQSALAASSAPIKLVTMHHAPYSSGEHGPSAWMQWPFKAWGATVVLAGHDHIYERLVVGDAPYLVNGLGGAALYALSPPVAGSLFRFASEHGALLVEADDAAATFKLVTAGGNVVDTFTATPTATYATEAPLVAAGSTWRYRDDGADLGVAWTQPSFDDAAWPAGPAQLGYGDGDEATVIGFGPNPDAKHVTSYFRRAFTVADASAFVALRLRVLRDDGAVVHLNGVEVFRTNMPAGAITFQTLASAGVSGGDESAFYEATLPASAVHTGGNVLAVEVHQSSVTSSDVSFDLQLFGELAGPALVPAGATWKYLDDGSTPSLAWRGAGFDDSAWASGPAQLGYGDGDEATVVSFGPNASQKFVTTYFRRAFTVASPAAVKGLVMKLLKDDGAVVYLNGHEVYRGDLPYGPIASMTLAPIAVGGADESAFVETSLDPRWLAPGANVIAVEVHQSSVASSDLSFDLELRAVP